MERPSLTLGIEEEYQVVDPETRELRSYVTEIMEDGQVVLENVHPELHASTLEVASQVCADLTEAREELVRLRRQVRSLARESGLEIMAAGTHPAAAWEQQDITPIARYRGLEEDMADLARRMLIFGLHVHVGIEDREFLIDTMNVARYFLPHLLCLSTSSPFWRGRRTGLKSYRSVVWENFPRTGIPPELSSWTDYERTVETLVNTGCIEDGTKIWWDVRPNWTYPTLEFRICDACPRLDEVLCLAGLFQALVLKLWRLRRVNQTFRVYPKSLLDENKWRAARYGLEGRLIDFGRQEELPARDLIRELIEDFLADPIDELGIRSQVEYAYTIMEEGTSAERQLAAYEEEGRLEAVVDQLVAETSEGLAEGAAG
jgi:carboxylate-amine ligase